jgi:hypothetical protein
VLRLTILLVAASLLAGCGSTKHVAGPPRPGPGTVVYLGGEWAVVVDHGKATAQHLVGTAWQTDSSGAVKISVLGPHPGSKQPATPQVAAELRAPAPLVESALWVDGAELLEKGGGLSPTRGTIYGAPASPLAPGQHRAVAYARTATHATAVAWTFHV